MSIQTIKLSITIAFFDMPAAVVENKAQIDAAREELNDQLARLNAMEKANQRMCQHPKTDLKSVLTSNTDGFAYCGRCGADL